MFEPEVDDSLYKGRSDGTQLIVDDHWLKPYEKTLHDRWSNFEHLLDSVNTNFGGVSKLSDYHDWGMYFEIQFINKDTTFRLTSLEFAPVLYILNKVPEERKTVKYINLVYREWANNAAFLSVIGDFNGWNKEETCFKTEKENYGVWRATAQVKFDDFTKDVILPIPNYGLFKVYMITNFGEQLYRMPQRVLNTKLNREKGQLESIFVVPEKEESVAQLVRNFTFDTFVGKVSLTEISALEYCESILKIRTKTNDLKINKMNLKELSNSEISNREEDKLRIYEVHVGMATPKYVNPDIKKSNGEDIGTYREFADILLDRIKAKHYNAIQIMAVMEHSYYASFGYQVTSFFAPSSRYGSPEDFCYLVEEAHKRGIKVLLDIVQSHASKNEVDGISRWDGNQFLFCREDHPLWDSKVFDLTNPETIRFLLQNIRFWLEQFNVDGFRFDAISSIMYYHRSAGVGYTGRYGEYFDEHDPKYKVDVPALSYLRLVHTFIMLWNLVYKKQVITIAEDVSGYPGLASPLGKGGVGFDYRFQMAIPDLWIKLMKKGFDDGRLDHDLHIGDIRYIITNRRRQEKNIAYCECHDQSLVGDKTLSMWLLNEFIYKNMSILQKPEYRVERAIHMHKLIRFVTIGLGGAGYLAFFGNEFGHPEWVDFPSPANNWDYSYCRRQWYLEDEKNLTRFKDLGEFDKKLMKLNEDYWWNNGNEYVLTEDEAKNKKILAWERYSDTGIMLIFIACFTNFITIADECTYIPVRKAGRYTVVLNSEEVPIGGCDTDNRFATGTEYLATAKNFKQTNQYKSKSQTKELCAALQLKLYRQSSLVLKYLGPLPEAEPELCSEEDIEEYDCTENGSRQ